MTIPFTPSEGEATPEVGAADGFVAGAAFSALNTRTEANVRAQLQQQLQGDQTWSALWDVFWGFVSAPFEWMFGVLQSLFPGLPWDEIAELDVQGIADWINGQVGEVPLLGDLVEFITGSVVGTWETLGLWFENLRSFFANINFLDGNFDLLAAAEDFIEFILFPVRKIVDFSWLLEIFEKLFPGLDWDGALALPSIDDLLSWFGNAIGQIPFLGEVTQAITDAIAGIWGGITGIFQKLFPDLPWAEIAALDVQGVIDWMVAALNGVPFVSDVVQWISDAVAGVWGGIVDVFKKLFPWLPWDDILGLDLAGIIDWLKTSLSEVPFFGDLFQWLTGAVGGTAATLSQWFENLRTFLASINFFDPNFDLLAAAEAFIDFILFPVKKIVDFSWLFGVFAKIFPGLDWDALASMTSMEELLDWFIDAVEAIPFVGPLIADIGEWLTGAVGGTAATLSQWFANLRSFLGNLNFFDPNFDLLGAAEAFIDFILSPVGKLAEVGQGLIDWINETLIKPVIGVLTGGVSLDLGALGVWARGLLTGESRIPANNLFGQVSSSLFGIIPVSHISNEQPNLLTQGGFDSGDMVDAADGWTWDQGTSYTGGGGALSVTANGTVKVIYNNQSIPVSAGDKVALTAWYKTSGYAGSGTPILLSLIPFSGTTQQSAVTIGAGGAAASWTQLYGSTYVVPAGVTSLRVRLALSSAASAGTVWFDDVRLAKTGLLQQGLVERLVDAWNNFWNSIFGGSETGKTVDDVYIAGAALTNTASTAFTNAQDALTQLGQLVWNLLNAPATILGNIGGVIIDGLSSIGDFLAGLWNSLTGNSSSSATVAQVSTAVASVTSTASAASTSADTANAGLQTTWNDLYDAFNGTTGSTGKTSANARERGAVVRSTAVTADANALTGIANAAAAQTTANTSKTLVTASLTTGANIVTNPGFESASFYLNTGYAYATDVVRAGFRSVKGTANGVNYRTQYTTVTDAGVIKVPCIAGDVYYVEVYVRGATSNVQTSGGNFSIICALEVFDSAGNSFSYPSVSMTASTALNGVWTKLSGNVTVPTGGAYFASYVSLAPTVSNNEQYYFDDPKVYRVTEGYVADGKAVAAQATANTGVTNAATADAKAVVGQTLAKATIGTGASGNLATNPGFEQSGFFLGVNAVRSTESPRTGSYSAKITQPGNYYGLLFPVATDTTHLEVPAQPGDVYYIEYWIKGLSTNQPTAGNAWLQSSLFRTGGLPAANTSAGFIALESTHDDQWHKVSGSFKIPADTYKITFYIVTHHLATAGNVYYVDDVVVRNTTGTQNVIDNVYQAVNGGTAVLQDVSTVKTGVAAVLSTANTGVANAATADAKAVTADGKAVTAQTTVDNVIKAGAGNICTNAGFEDTTQYLWQGTYVTSPVRTGARAAKLVGDGYNLKYIPLTANSSTLVRFTSGPNRVYYLECWVRGDDANTHTGNAVRFYVGGYGAIGYITAAYQDFSATAIGTGQWVKLSATMTLPNNAAITNAMGYITLYGPPATDSYYFDDVIFRDITEAQSAQLDADAAKATGQGIIDGAYQAVNGGTSTGNTLDSVKTNIGAVLSKANEGITNAATAQNAADSAAGTAQLALKSGVNLLPNGGFEDLSIANDANGVRTADFARTGTYSMRLTGNGTYPYSYLTRDSSGPYWLPAQPSSVYRFTAWVRGAASNTETEFSAIRLGFACDITSTVYYHVQDFDISPALNSVWTKFEAYIQITSNPNAYRVRPYVQLKDVINSDVFYFDDLSIELVTDAYNAQLAAAAAADAASTADDNAADAAAKAIAINQSLFGQDTPAATIAQTKVQNLTTALGEKLTASSNLNADKLLSGTLPPARVADSSLPQAKTAGLKTTLVSKYNQVSNPGFEDTSFYLGQATYSTEVVRPNSGARSAKIVGTGGGQWAYLATSDTAIAPPAAGPGDVIYMECWIYGSTSNTLSSGGFYLYAQGFTGANGNVENLHAGGISATPALNGVWTKWSGYRKLEHADIRKVQLGVYCTPASGQVYYLDDPVVRFVTDANEINRALYGPTANAPGETILTGILPNGIDATKLSGTLADDRIPTLQQTKVSDLVDDLTVRRNLAISALAGGGFNMVTNPGFESNTFYLGNGVYDTSFKRTGTQSVKVTHNGSSYNLVSVTTSESGNLAVRVQPNSVFYAEAYIFASVNNTATHANGWFQATAYREDGTYGWMTTPSTSTTVLGDWLKVSGYLRVPSDCISIGLVWLVTSNTAASGNIYWWDDPIIREVTESDELNKALYGPNATAPGTEILTSAVPYGIDATKLSGTLADDRIPTLQTSKVSGLDDSLDAIDVKARDFSNIAAGSDFDGNHPWVLGTGFSIATDQYYSGTKSLKLSAGSGGRASYLGTYPTVFEAKPGDLFSIEMQARRSADFVSTIDGKLRVGDQDNNFIDALDLKTGADSGEGYVNALLHCNGFDGTTDIVDSSWVGGGWTCVGDARLSTSAYKFGSASINFNAISESGNTHHAVKATGTAADYGFGTSDFTFEMWFRSDDYYTTQVLYDSRPAANGSYYPMLYLYQGKLRYFVNYGARIIGTTTIANGVWYHVAVSRASGMTRMFLNGVLQGSWADSSNYLFALPSLGSSAVTAEAGTYNLKGYIDEFRLSKGLGRYTAAFTAPTAVFPDPTVNYNGVDSWQKLTKVVEVPAGDRGVIFTLQFNTTAGSLWLDDIVIRKVSPEGYVGATNSLALNQALFDQDTVGTAIAQTKVDGLPNDARVDTTLVDHSAKIQELEAASETAANQGRRIAVNFSDYPNGAMPSNFTVLYNGSGTSTIQVGSGMAGWVEGSNADRDAKIIYTGDPNDTSDDVLLTDFQKIRGTLGGIPDFPASGYATGPRFWAMGRINNTFSTYAQANTFVWARAFWKQGLQLRAQMGCTINGTEYLWVDDIPLTWSLDMTFLCGAGGNERVYQVWSGTTMVASFEENGYGINPSTGATIAVPYSTFGAGYRRWGSLSEIRYQGSDLKLSGPVSSVVVSDNATPEYNGSVARMSRTSGTDVAIASGENAVPNSFFLFNYESLDIDANATDGTFTVTKSKMYMVAARIRMTGASDNVFSVNLQKWNGSVWVTVQRGETVWPSDAFYGTASNLNYMAMTGTWLQYLNAGDKIRLATYRGPGGTATKYMDGTTNGEETYFTISALQ